MNIKVLAKFLPIEPALLKQIESFASTASDPVQFVQNSIAGPLFQPHIESLERYLQQSGAHLRMDLWTDPDDPTGQTRAFIFKAVYPDGRVINLKPYNTLLPKRETA